MFGKTRSNLFLVSTFLIIIFAYYWQPLLSALHYQSSTRTASKVTTIPSLVSHLSKFPAYSTMSAPRISRKLARAPVLAIELPEGVGAVVRRSIGSPRLRHWTPFLMLDHFKIGKGAGFPDHPHRGQATITLMQKGYFRHEDSKGHSGFIGPGDVQWMQAGKGIVHAEMPVHEEGSPDPEGLQLWVDLPKEHKMDEPDYQELPTEKIPVANPTENISIRVISGSAQGNEEQGQVESPIRPVGGCHYYEIKMNKRGDSLFQAIPKGWNAFIYTMAGDIYLGPSGSMVTPLKPYHTLILSSKDEQNGVLIESATDDVHFVLIAGEPLDQPIVQHGPFVVTSQSEVYQAFEDYQMGKNGFEGAREWASEIGGRKIKAPA